MNAPYTCKRQVKGKCLFRVFDGWQTLDSCGELSQNKLFLTGLLTVLCFETYVSNNRLNKLEARYRNPSGCIGLPAATI